jgi:hypothetical protein
MMLIEIVITCHVECQRLWRDVFTKHLGSESPSMLLCGTRGFEGLVAVIRAFKDPRVCRYCMVSMEVQ